MQIKKTDNYIYNSLNFGFSNSKQNTPKKNRYKTFDTVVVLCKKISTEEINNKNNIKKIGELIFNSRKQIIVRNTKEMNFFNDLQHYYEELTNKIDTNEIKNEIKKMLEKLE